MLHTQARIDYLLSESGRKDSLRNGGNGHKHQYQMGSVNNAADLAVFTVDEEGQVSFDATLAPASFEPNGKHTCVVHPPRGDSPSRREVLWSVVPTWDDLMEFARWAHNVREEQELEERLDWAHDTQTKDHLRHRFLADPTARADKVADDYVTIAGYDFRGAEDSIVVEARARFAVDQEKLRNANRATLTAWISRHGTTNQKQRLAAGLLPWPEAYESLEEQLYAPLKFCRRYERFALQEVCECQREDGTFCKVKFKSVDAASLTADEWEQFSKIKALAPEAKFQLREHSAECVTAFAAKIRRGVIVKFAVDCLTFKREFALTEVAMTG